MRYWAFTLMLTTFNSFFCQQRPPAASLSFAKKWGTVSSLQRAKLASSVRSSSSSFALSSAHLALRSRSFSTAPQSPHPSSNQSDELTALSSQVRKLVASEDYAAAQQLLAQSTLPMESFSLALLSDAYRTFTAMQDDASAYGCGLMIFDLEQGDCDISLVSVLVDRMLRAGMPNLALNSVLRLKSQTLLIKQGIHKDDSLLKEGITYDALFSDLTRLKDKAEAIQLLTLFRESLRVRGRASFASLATKAIFQFDPERIDAQISLLSIMVCEASTREHVRERFLEEVVEVHKVMPEIIYLSQFYLEALSLMDRHDEVIEASEPMIQNHPDFGFYVAPWYLTAQLKLRGIESAKKTGFELGSIEALFMNEEQTFLGKVQVLQHLFDLKDRPLMERLLFEQLLEKESALSLDEVQMMFGFSTRLYDASETPDRIRFLEAFVRASRYPSLWATGNLGVSYYRVDDYESAYHYLSQIPSFDNLTPQERSMLASCAEHKGLLEEALELYSDCSGKHEHFANVRSSSILLKLGRFEEAIQYYAEWSSNREPYAPRYPY